MASLTSRASSPSPVEGDELALRAPPLGEDIGDAEDSQPQVRRGPLDDVEERPWVPSRCSMIALRARTSSPSTRRSGTSDEEALGAAGELRATEGLLLLRIRALPSRDQGTPGPQDDEVNPPARICKGSSKVGRVDSPVQGRIPV